MRKYLSSAVCAAALLLSSVSMDAILAPASAQSDVSIDFDTIHDQLAPYGDWVYSDRWGEVWTPGDVPDDFHPYGTGGHWAYTDQYGWTWASDYEWGDIPFHYGRWVNDPDDGWLWIPGYVWSPGWVVWRHNGQYTGWMPMPPDDEFLGRGPQEGPSVGISIGGLSVNFNNTDDNYGYSRWYGGGYDQNRFASNWFFIGTGHMADNDYGRYQAPPSNYVTLIHNTTNITNYTVVNNYVVNKSVNVQEVEKAGGHPVQAVHLADVIRKPQYVTHADSGRAAQTRSRDERPRGTGMANSAPAPTPKVVQSLSTNVKPHAGHPAAHLFTRETVAKAPLAPAPAHGPAMKAAPAHTPAADSMSAPTTLEPGKPPHELKHPDRMTPPTSPDAAPARTTPETARPVPPGEMSHGETMPGMTEAPVHKVPKPAAVETRPVEHEMTAPPPPVVHARPVVEPKPVVEPRPVAAPKPVVEHKAPVEPPAAPKKPKKPEDTDAPPR